MKKNTGKIFGCFRFFLFIIIFVLASICLCTAVIFTMGNYGEAFKFSDIFVRVDRNTSESSAVTSYFESEISSEADISSMQDTGKISLKEITPQNEIYTVEAEKSIQISVIFYPQNASNKELEWSVNDETVASVDNNGNVRAKFPGECQITAVSKADPSIKFTVPLTVVKIGAYPSSTQYLIRVYKGSQSIVVYAKDAYGGYTIQTKVFTCSTGAKSTPTRSGTYKTINKYRWRLMMGPTYGQYATSFSTGYLFHSVPSSQQKNNTMSMGGYAKLGTPASHGCVRLCVADAKWIYDHCELRTAVEVVDEAGPAGPAPAALNWRYPGWDPTDPDPSNPYHKEDA